VPEEPEPLDFNRVIDLQTLLADLEKWGRGWAPYFPRETQALSPATRCLMVFDLWDDLEAEALASGWKPGLNTEDLSDIESNLRQQTSEVTLALLVKAVEYYWCNDAFVDLTTHKLD